MNLKNIEQQVEKSVPKIDKSKSPKEYFQLGGALLKAGGEYKRAQDYEGAYFNLRAYIFLIEKRLPEHPDIKHKDYIDEYYFNKEKIPVIYKELESLEKILGVKKDPNFKPVATVVTTRNNLPPVPTKGNQKETIEDKMMKKIVNNEQVQEHVGREVSKLAQNEKVQEKVASTISNVAKDEKVKRGVGEAIASSSDNLLVKQIARNEQVQDVVSVTIQKTIGNKEVQKKIGQAISDAAQDKETQKKVAQGILTIGKGAIKGGTWLGSVGLSVGKIAYNEYMKDEKEKK